MNLPLFIPIVWGAALGVTALLGIGSYKLFSKDPEKNKLGILGIQTSGKTRFLCHLRGIKYVERPTEIEKYKPFRYKTSSKVIYVDAGEDIGGGNLYRSEYDRIIEDSDVIFYFFDISKYIDNPIEDGISYRRACNSRIEHIYTAKRELKNNIVIVGTHLDLYKRNKSKAKSEFLKLNESKVYFPILKQIVLIDLTDENQIKNFTNKVFK